MLRVVYLCLYTYVCQVQMYVYIQCSQALCVCLDRAICTSRNPGFIVNWGKVNLCKYVFSSYLYQCFDRLTNLYQCFDRLTYLYQCFDWLTYLYQCFDRLTYVPKQLTLCWPTYPDVWVGWPTCPPTLQRLTNLSQLCTLCWLTQPDVVVGWPADPNLGLVFHVLLP